MEDSDWMMDGVNMGEEAKECERMEKRQKRKRKNRQVNEEAEDDAILRIRRLGRSYLHEDDAFLIVEKLRRSQEDAAIIIMIDLSRSMKHMINRFFKSKDKVDLMSALVCCGP